MNRFAYLSTSFAIKTISSLSRARVHLHNAEHIAPGPAIYVINHFTRLETLLIPYHLHQLSKRPIWSLADAGLFTPSLSSFFEKVGVVSTKAPDRDRLMVKTLLSGEASWVVFPEGMMVKSKKIVEKGRYMIAYAGGKHPPHTGAAALALRTEFYRQRLRRLHADGAPEATRLLEKFGIQDIRPVLAESTRIIPVNLTYYPMRARENALSRLAARFRGDLPERFVEELMTEGSMLIEGVDLDIRFGDPIDVASYLDHRRIQKDIRSAAAIDFDDPIPSITAMRKAAVRLMQAYMQAIYTMTTVNHDHLFATFLRLHPFQRMSAFGLKLRVFLAAQLQWDLYGVRVHSSLQSGQMHLLSDDAFGKYKEFIDLALSKHAVVMEDQSLVRQHAVFAPIWDLHRVRVDNPIGVIANEVEPLETLLRKIRRLAWTPEWILRRRAARMIMAREAEHYQQDYRAFYKEAESKDISVGMPYLVRGNSRRVGVLLIHGYMAAPLEVKELAIYLGQRGFWVYAPRLRGHGTAPGDLATRTYQDWQKSVDAGYAVIRALCTRVVIGGFSNGAALALDLTARLPEAPLGVFAVAPPMRLQDFSARFVPAVDVWNRLLKKVGAEKATKEFVDNHPEHPHINYHRNPISGLHQLERLMDKVADKLHQVQAPALVIQALGDPVVSADGTRKVFEKLGSADKTYMVLNYQRHGILMGEGANRVHCMIGDFIRRLHRQRSVVPAAPAAGEREDTQ
ncbi:MAG: alpha/beta fold hydrolase [Pseudomonadota bacterium]